MTATIACSHGTICLRSPFVAQNIFLSPRTPVGILLRKLRVKTALPPHELMDVDNLTGWRQDSGTIVLIIVSLYVFQRRYTSTYVPSHAL
jgi:hypothetical protein